MQKFNLIATSAFGIESIVKEELTKLGFNDFKTENGRINFLGTERDIIECNLWLRTSDRILIKMAEFPAETFDDLFDGVYDLNWSDFLPVDAKIHVTGKSVKSILHSVPNCQAIVKKAIVENLKKKYRVNWFEENGALYKIEVSILKDIATISIDTSGASLHKRGYRTDAGDAPLKETLAAAMVYLSHWTPERTLSDPFCGSATIGIEAGLMAKNIAPGINRRFVSEEWDWIPKKLWQEEREIARNSIKDIEFKILCSDLDFRVLNKARENIKNAGLENFVYIQKLPMEDFRSKKKCGCIVTNPPYGERLGEQKEVRLLYERMGETFSQLNSWDYYILTSDEEFESSFRKQASKKRKLYNGNIKCNLYQYFNSYKIEKD